MEHLRTHVYRRTPAVWHRYLPCPRPSPLGRRFAGIQRRTGSHRCPGPCGAPGQDHHGTGGTGAGMAGIRALFRTPGKSFRTGDCTLRQTGTESGRLRLYAVDKRSYDRLSTLNCVHFRRTKDKELTMKANVYDKGQAPTGTQKTKAPSRKRSWVWLVIGLILLSAIPLAGGAFRLSQLSSGAEITPDNARFFASPLPVVLHIVGAIVYAFLGAFQFVSRLWQRGVGWHRWVGRVLLVPC